MKLFENNTKLFDYLSDILMFTFLSYLYDPTYTMNIFLFDLIFLYLQRNLSVLFPKNSYIKASIILFSSLYCINRMLCLLGILAPILIGYTTK